MWTPPRKVWEDSEEYVARPLDLQAELERWGGGSAGRTE
jgi:hypothetical protein